MVVRSLQETPAGTFLTPNPQPRTLVFHLADVESANTAYLTHYASTNDRFGAFRFATTSFPLQVSTVQSSPVQSSPAQDAPLALVIWVQDPVTKDVLQTTFAPLPPN